MKVSNIVIVTLIVMLSGCSGFSLSDYSFKSPLPPWQRWMEKGPPGYTDGTKKYDPDYVDGWIDGCHTGIGAVAPVFYAQFYTFSQDPLRAQEPIYYKGWKDALDYCNRYTYEYRRRKFL